MNTDAPNWQRLGAAIKARRAELRLTQHGIRDAGGPSQATVVKLESPEGVPGITPETKKRLEQALRWVPGSVDAALAGGIPTPLTDAPSRIEVISESPGERILVQIVAGVSELPEKDRREVLALIQAKLGVAP
jgi:hypothetical protein